MQEIATEVIKDYKRAAENPKQKYDIKIYNTDDKISSSGESTQESRKAKTSHLGKDETMSE